MKAEMVNGSVIGNYRVQQKLGETADFILFSGKTLDTEQEVLLKAMRQPPALIRLALPDFQGRTTRFMQLRHPHLCAVREILRDENAFYIVTDLQRGQPLSEALAHKKQFPYQAAVTMIAQLLELLEYLHQQKVNCLDLRPSNLYLSDDRSLQLADAGLIQLLSLENQTTAPETVSALEYTAPERILYSKILGTKVDARADLYAVGVLFYELLAGQPPLRAESRENMIRAQIETVPLPLSSLVAGVPAPIEQVIFRALEKSPERRFAAAETMQTALRRAQAPEASLAPLEPSLAFLMESLQLADGPSASAVSITAMHKGATGGLKANPNTGSLPQVFTNSGPLTGPLTNSNTGKLPTVKPTLDEKTAESETSAADPHDVPTLRPRGQSAPLDAPVEVKQASVTPAELEELEEPEPADMQPDWFDAEESIFNDSVTEPLSFDEQGLDPLPTDFEQHRAADTRAEEKVTLNDLFPPNVEPSATVEIEILPESIVMVEPDDDRAFDELRSTMLPRSWQRKAMYAAAGLGLMFLVGCSVYWMARPAPSPLSQHMLPAVSLPEVTPTTAPATVPTTAPTTTIEPAKVASPSSTPKPTATPKLTPTPKPSLTPKPTPTSKPSPTPKPAPTPKVQSTTMDRPADKPAKAQPVRPAKPSLLVEKERRKRAILNSLTQ